MRGQGSWTLAACEKAKATNQAYRSGAGCRISCPGPFVDRETPGCACWAVPGRTREGMGRPRLDAGVSLGSPGIPKAERAQGHHHDSGWKPGHMRRDWGSWACSAGDEEAKGIQWHFPLPKGVPELPGPDSDSLSNLLHLQHRPCWKRRQDVDPHPGASLQSQITGKGEGEKGSFNQCNYCADS